MRKSGCVWCDHTNFTAFSTSIGLLHDVVIDIDRNNKPMWNRVPCTRVALVQRSGATCTKCGSELIWDGIGDPPTRCPVFPDCARAGA